MNVTIRFLSLTSVLQWLPCASVQITQNPKGPTTHKDLIHSSVNTKGTVVAINQYRPFSPEHPKILLHFGEELNSPLIV